MKRSLVTVIAAFGFLLICLGISIPAYAVPQSDYYSTCQNISIDGRKLKADCLTYDKDWRVGSTLNLLGFENINGQLTETGQDDSSTFQETCKNISINKAILSAICTNRDASSKLSSAVLTGIVNENGYLKYVDR